MAKPTVEHRHFKAIADIIRRMDDGALWPVQDIRTHFADWLADTHPRFNRERFLAACKGTPTNGHDKVRS